MKRDIFALESVVGRVFLFKLLMSSILVFLLLNVSNLLADTLSPLETLLSARHFSATETELTETAGGSEELIKQLLLLRTKETPPFVGVRAEKLLLGYSHRPEVEKALSEDVVDSQRTGLARLIVMHIDKVSSESCRRNLAKLAVERANKEPAFAPYVRTLADSTDREVSRIARSALK